MYYFIGKMETGLLGDRKLEVALFYVLFTLYLHLDTSYCLGTPICYLILPFSPTTIFSLYLS